MPTSALVIEWYFTASRVLPVRLRQRIPKPGRHWLQDVLIIHLCSGSFWIVGLAHRDPWSESATECIPVINQQTRGIVISNSLDAGDGQPGAERWSSVWPARAALACSSGPREPAALWGLLWDVGCSAGRNPLAFPLLLWIRHLVQPQHCHLLGCGLGWVVP